MKKLVIKADDCPGVIGGRAFILCDAETGEALPRIYSCELRFETGDTPFVSVSFRIDGDNVRLDI